MDRFIKPIEDLQSSTPVMYRNRPFAPDVRAIAISGANLSTQMSTPSSILAKLSGMVNASSLNQPKELIADQIVEGRYKIVSFIGRGGIGSVYKAEQILLKKQVALKTLNPVLINDKTVRRFHKEAQAASRLEHPNLVRALDFGIVHEYQPYLVMEFVEGPSLAQYLQGLGRLPVQTALQIAIPICFAIAYAHHEGVIHRDIKPGNIVLVPNESDDSQFVPKIVDFGIAKFDFGGENAQSLTGTGEVFGTPLYMSPEQCAGVQVDSRSDIYSLGCVLFECLTGAPPFRGQSVLETMMQHGNGILPSLKEASLGVEFPEALERIVAKMLEKNPQHRYQSSLDVAKDLLWLQQGKPEYVQVEHRTKTNDVVHSNTRARASTLLALGIFGLAFACVMAGYSIGQSKQTAAVSVAVPVADHDTAASWFPSWNPDDGFFSQVDHGQRIFRLPTKHTLGEFYWWDKNNGFRAAEAQNLVKIPVNAPTLLRLSWETLQERPYYLSHFRNDDVAGIMVRPQEFAALVTDDDMTERAFQSIAELRALRVLTIRNAPLSEQVVLKFGELPKLRWLVLDHIERNGDVIARMKNLPKLLVFGANYIDNAGSILRMLTRSGAVRRLSLEGSSLTEPEIIQISKLSSLTHLDLANNFSSSGGPAIANQQERERIFARLAKLTNLKCLCIEQELLGNVNDEKIWESLAQMKTLKVLFFNGSAPTDVQCQRIKLCLPGCEVRQIANRKALKWWFDPIVENPSVGNLW